MRLHFKVGPLIIEKRLEASRTAKPQGQTKDIATAILLAGLAVFMVVMFLIGHYS